MEKSRSDIESHQRQGLLRYNDNRSSTESSPAELDIDYSTSSHAKRRSWQSTLVTVIKLIAVFITIASLTANVWIFVTWSKNFNTAKLHEHNSESSADSKCKLTYSPADSSIEHQLKSLNFKEPHDVYVGPPTNATDEAWSALLKPIHLRITAEELRIAEKQSIRLHDETENYLGYIEVYHQLHCLKRMMQNRWPERYPEVAESGGMDDGHFNHCLQMLRKGVMCQPDVTINTWTWDKVNQTKLTSITEPPRTCINWDRFHNWALSRTVGPDYRSQLYSFSEKGWLGPDL